MGLKILGFSKSVNPLPAKKQPYNGVSFVFLNKKSSCLKFWNGLLIPNVTPAPHLLSINIIFKYLWGGELSISYKLS